MSENLQIIVGVALCIILLIAAHVALSWDEYKQWWAYKKAARIKAKRVRIARQSPPISDPEGDEFHRLTKLITACNMHIDAAKYGLDLAQWFLDNGVNKGLPQARIHLNEANHALLLLRAIATDLTTQLNAPESEINSPRCKALCYNLASHANRYLTQYQKTHDELDACIVANSK